MDFFIAKSVGTEILFNGIELLDLMTFFLENQHINKKTKSTNEITYSALEKQDNYCQRMEKVNAGNSILIQV